MGFAGHLWSHGIAIEERQNKLTRLMRGDSDWREVARELGATHIFWGREERKNYGSGPLGWQGFTRKIGCPKVGEEEIAIYEIL